MTIAGQTARGTESVFGITLFGSRTRRTSSFAISISVGDENKPVPSGDDCINTDDVDHVIFITSGPRGELTAITICDAAATLRFNGRSMRRL